MLAELAKQRPAAPDVERPQQDEDEDEPQHLMLVRRYTRQRR